MPLDSRSSLGVLVTGVGLVLEQLLGGAGVTERDGVEERRAAVLIFIINARAILH